jgi:hypothetical protein
MVTPAILRTTSGNLTNTAATGWMLYMDDILGFNGVHLLTQICIQHTHRHVLYVVHTLSPFFCHGLTCNMHEKPLVSSAPARNTRSPSNSLSKYTIDLF